jgi:PhnB protein
MAKKKVKKAPKKTAARKPAKRKAARPAAKKATTKKPAAKKVAAKKPTAAPTPRGTMINPYLTFNGTCEEAFNFYKQVFGGKFSYVGRFKEMPPAEGQPPIPESEGEKIMHVSLPISNETILMGSDSFQAMGTVEGNNFSVSISAPSEAKADGLFRGLSTGGQVTMPMNKTFWGSYFGMLKDRFGIQWMISFDKNFSGN